MNLQGEKTSTASQQDMGWRAQRTCSLLPVAGKVFLLTLPFIERANRTCGFQVSDYPTNQELAATFSIQGCLDSLSDAPDGKVSSMRIGGFVPLCRIDLYCASVAHNGELAIRSNAGKALESIGADGQVVEFQE